MASPIMQELLIMMQIDTNSRHASHASCLIHTYIRGGNVYSLNARGQRADAELRQLPEHVTSLSWDLNPAEKEKQKKRTRLKKRNKLNSKRKEVKDNERIFLP